MRGRVGIAPALSPTLEEPQAPPGGMWPAELWLEDAQVAISAALTGVGRPPEPQLSEPGVPAGETGGWRRSGRGSRVQKARPGRGAEAGVGSCRLNSVPSGADTDLEGLGPTGNGCGPTC